MCIIRACLSVLRILFGIVFEFPLKRASRKSKAIPAVLLGIAMITVCQWASAQEGSISGSHKDVLGNRGVEGITVTVKDASASALAETATTDQSGNESLRIPFPGSYTVLASRPGYDSMSALDVTEIFDTIPNGSVDILTKQEAWLKYRSSQPKPGLSWETGARKSYLIPALEIPGFIFALNGFDRLVFRNQETEREESLQFQPFHLLGPSHPRPMAV